MSSNVQIRHRIPVVLKDAVTSVSLANLLLLPAWTILRTLSFFLDRQARPVVFAGVLMDLLLLAGLLFAGIRVLRRVRSPAVKDIARAAFLALLLIPADFLRRQLTSTSSNDLYRSIVSSASLTLALLVLTAIAGTLFVRDFRRVFRFAGSFIRMMTPCVVVTLPLVVKPLLLPVVPGQGPFAPPAVRASMGPRVVWLLFDELDQREAFTARAPDVRLPELDRFAGQAISLTGAYAPVNVTIRAIPSLLTGRVVSASLPAGADLSVAYADSTDPATPLQGDDTILGVLQKAGVRTSVVGWYLPYCRLFPADLSSCAWATDRDEADPDLSWQQAMVRPLAATIWIAPFAHRVGLDRALLSDAAERTARQKHLQSYEFIRRNALVEVTSPQRGLVFVHWPVPHLPAVYDRAADQPAVVGRQGYRDNLVLVDKTLGLVRGAMDRAGTWDDSVVIVTSDHWWREAPVIDHRVPLMIKMPGATERIVVTSNFSTVGIHDLILRLLTGGLSKPGDVATWLRDRRFRPASADGDYVQHDQGDGRD